MINQNSNDLIPLADDINRYPLLTEYLKSAKRGFVCPECGNGSGDDGTGAIIKDNKLMCGKCLHSFNNIDIIAHHLGLSTRGRDFVEVVKFGCQFLGIDFPTSNFTPQKRNLPKPVPAKVEKVEKAELFERLAEAQHKLDKFVESQGGSWRGLSFETLKRMNAGFLPDVYFPAAKKVLPAVVIPNDLGGVYFRSIQGKFHKNNVPMATTTIYLPEEETFDIVITEGQINAASIFQAVFSVTHNFPKFAIMAGSGTGAGQNTILPRLQQLRAHGKKFRVIIAYDNDSNGAGQTASKTALESILRAGYVACRVDITKSPDIDCNDVLNVSEGIVKLTSNVFCAVGFAEDEFEKIEKDNYQKIFGENISAYVDSQFPDYVGENKKFADRKTGFANLDDEIKTFRPGIYIVGGLPALGKTTFVLQLLWQLALNGEFCFYASYEMEKGFLTSKLLAHEMARIESKNFDRTIVKPLSATNISLGKLFDHKDTYRAAVKNFTEKQIPLHIWEFDDTNIDSLLSDVESICAKLDKPPIVAVDYLQLLASNAENTKAALDNILHKIFTCRRRTNATFIVISSLNRANYNTEISFESFKETGNIEYSADVIWGLQLKLDKRNRAEVENAKKQIPREVQLVCLKNRFGANFDIGFFYYPNCDTFLPMLEYGEYIEHRSDDNKTATANDDEDNE